MDSRSLFATPFAAAMHMAAITERKEAFDAAVRGVVKVRWRRAWRAGAVDVSDTAQRHRPSRSATSATGASPCLTAAVGRPRWPSAGVAWLGRRTRRRAFAHAPIAPPSSPLTPSRRAAPGASRHCSLAAGLARCVGPQLPGRPSPSADLSLSPVQEVLVTSVNSFLNIYNTILSAFIPRPPRPSAAY